MAFCYNYLEYVALADVAFDVEADGWNDLFTGATEAMTGVMVDLRDLAVRTHRTIQMAAPSADQLLFDWLSELVYLKDTEGLLVKRSDVAIESGGIWQARGTLHGEPIDPLRHRLGQDVKAVTYHLFSVAGDAHHCTARVVLDI